MVVAHSLFFPDAIFGWFFYVLLVGFLVVAAYNDVLRITIPKKLTLTMLGVGLLFNLARGTWLGISGSEDSVWILPAGPAWGWLDGLLFALSGFGLGLVMFLALYIFGMAGGGDLKLAAALGAWVGPWYVVYIFLGTAVVMLILAFADLARRLIRKGPQRTIFSLGNRPTTKQGKAYAVGLQRKNRSVAYALPIAITTSVVILLVNAEQLLGVKRVPVPTEVKQTATAPQ